MFCACQRRPKSGIAATSFKGLLAFALVSMLSPKAMAADPFTVMIEIRKSEPAVDLYIDDFDEAVAPTSAGNYSLKLEAGPHLLIFKSMRYGSIDLISAHIFKDTRIVIDNVRWDPPSPWSDDNCIKQFKAELSSTSGPNVNGDMGFSGVTNTPEIETYKSRNADYWNLRYPNTKAYLVLAADTYNKIYEEYWNLFMPAMRMDKKDELIGQVYREILKLDRQGVDPLIARALANYCMLGIANEKAYHRNSPQKFFEDEVLPELNEELLYAAPEVILIGSNPVAGILIGSAISGVQALMERDASYDVAYMEVEMAFHYSKEYIRQIMYMGWIRYGAPVSYLAPLNETFPPDATTHDIVDAGFLGTGPPRAKDRTILLDPDIRNSWCKR